MRNKIDMSFTNMKVEINTIETNELFDSYIEDKMSFGTIEQKLAALYFQNQMLLEEVRLLHEDLNLVSKELNRKSEWSDWVRKGS